MKVQMWRSITLTSRSVTRMQSWSSRLPPLVMFVRCSFVEVFSRKTVLQVPFHQSTRSSMSITRNHWLFCKVSRLLGNGLWVSCLRAMSSWSLCQFQVHNRTLFFYQFFVHVVGNSSLCMFCFTYRYYDCGCMMHRRKLSRDSALQITMMAVSTAYHHHCDLH